MKSTAIHDWVKKRQDEWIALRRHLHSFPELSHKEFKTSQYVAEFLQREGIAVQAGAAVTGLVTQNKGRVNRTIGLRCDLDALQITEETGSPFASRHPGVMHACGHDVHTSVVAGTNVILHALRDNLPGNVKCIYQPAEEADRGGAEMVIREGFIDDVEAMFGIHVDPSLPVGKFGVRAGAMMASIDFFEITVRGPGGHGARPHQTVDTLFVTSQVMNALYQMHSRRFSALEQPSVISICKINGGHQANVIPASCTFAGTFRTFDDAVRVQLRQLVEETAVSISRAHGAECEVRITPNAPPVINDERLGLLVEETIAEVFGEESIVRLEHPMTASEDFAYYREKCPIYFLRLGIASGEATSYPLHSPKFNVDERVIGYAVELLSNLMIRYFEK
ncbi:amidohydrolase [bacterium]|nr:amidohydrolase [bacterium]